MLQECTTVFTGINDICTACVCLGETILSFYTNRWLFKHEYNAMCDYKVSVGKNSICRLVPGVITCMVEHVRIVLLRAISAERRLNVSFDN